MISAGLARHPRLLLRRNRGDHHGATGFRHLNGVLADRPGAAGDEQRRSRFGVRELDRLERRHRRDAEASPFLEAHMGGQRHRLRHRQYDELRGRAEGALKLAVPDPYPLAHARRRHARANRFNLARAVAVRNHAREDKLAQAPALHVRRIDAGGAQRAHAPRPGRASASRCRPRAAHRARDPWLRRMQHAYSVLPEANSARRSVAGVERETQARAAPSLKNARASPP